MTRARALAIPVAAAAPLGFAPDWRSLPSLLRELLPALGRGRGRPPARRGGPQPPPEPPRRQSHWDDPHLWMLMMH